MYCSKIIPVKCTSTSIFLLSVTQLKFTCSKSTTETLEKGMKYVQSYLFIVQLLIKGYFCDEYVRKYTGQADIQK